MQKKINILGILSQFKLIIQKYFVLLRPCVEALLLQVKQIFVVHKETIYKISVPFIIIFLGFYACSSSQKTISKNLSDIFVISDDLRNNYVDKPDYWGLSTEKVIKDSLISDRFIRNGKIILSGGEEILVGNGVNADIIMPRMQTFDIILKNLNKAQCISYVESPISQENQVKILMIGISNSNGVYTFEWGKEPYKLPVDKYAAKNICSTSNNTVFWSFQ